MAGHWQFLVLAFLPGVSLSTFPLCPPDVPCCSDTDTELEEVTDIKYGEADFLNATQELYLDLYRPLNFSAPHPVVVNVHGGSFSPQSSKSDWWIVAESRRWARRGFLVAAIEYRRHGDSGEAGPRTLIDPAHDTLAAVRYLVNNSIIYGVDVHNIALYGCSAGGITVAIANILDLGEGNSGTPGVNANVSVTFALSGGIYGDLSEVPDIGPKAPEDIAPYIAVHNAADPLVPYAYANATANLLNMLGVQNELVTLDGDGHCEDPVSLVGESNAILFDDIVGFMLSHMTVRHCRLMPQSSNSTSGPTTSTADVETTEAYVAPLVGAARSRTPFTVGALSAFYALRNSLAVR
mmetsp:Transcript_69720/g.130151  ORF Transcript_69720/g.130151 Transcript_69720/m.130151 type:complete len:351 (+) Transcript_69720:46-1098(+)